MKPAELAQWLHDEHARVHEMTHQLRQMVASVPRLNRDAWVDELRKAFEHLRAHLTKHMALEEQDGYFSCVREHRPGLEAEVARLEREHAEMLKLMTGIQTALHELTQEDFLLLRDACGRITQFINYVDHHEKDEQLLATYAFTQDIGAKD